MSRLKAALRSLQEDNGQALIEMALVLPLFFMLLFGLIGFATVLFGWCNINYASRAAARYASIHSSTSLNPATSASISAVVAPLLLGASPGGATSIASYSTSNVIGATVTITVTASYPVVMPFTSYSSFTISSSDQRTLTR